MPCAAPSESGRGVSDFTGRRASANCAISAEKLRFFRAGALKYPKFFDSFPARRHTGRADRAEGTVRVNAGADAAPRDRASERGAAGMPAAELTSLTPRKESPMPKTATAAPAKKR